jgi:hypothetical protein
MAEETIEEMWKRIEEGHVKTDKLQELRNHMREMDERNQQRNERIRQMRQKWKQENKYSEEEITNRSESIDSINIEERVKQLMNCKQVENIKDKLQRNQEEINIRTIVLQEVEDNINQRDTKMRQELQKSRQELEKRRQEREQNRLNREKDHEKFTSRMKRSDEKVKDIVQNFEKRNEIEEVSEPLEPTQINIKPEIKDIAQNFGIKESDSSETVVQIHTNFGKRRKRRIRKVRILKTLGLTTRIYGNQKVREYNRSIKQKHEQNKTRKKCNAVIYRKVPLIHPSEVKGRSKVFQNVPSKAKTKVNFSKEIVFQKVKLKKTSEKYKKQITGVNSTRRLGERLHTKWRKCKSNKIYIFQNDKFNETLKTCTNCQMLQSSYQTRTKVTKQNPKVRTNLHERSTERVKLKVLCEIPHERLIKESTVPKHTFRVGNQIHENRNDQRLTNRKIPSKMKGKVITKLRKINSKMKINLGINWPELRQDKKTGKKGFFKTKEGLPLLKAKQIQMNSNFKMKRKEIRASESKVAFKIKESLPLSKAKQIPFKMKRLVAIDFRKPNVRMKANVRWPCFGKLRWKFKDGNYNPKTMS